MVLGGEPLSQVTFVTSSHYLGRYHWSFRFGTKKIGTGVENFNLSASQNWKSFYVETIAVEKAEKL